MAETEAQRIAREAQNRRNATSSWLANQGQDFAMNAQSTTAPAVVGVSKGAYMGSKPGVYTAGPMTGAPTGQMVPQFMSYQDARNVPMSWDQKTLDKFIIDGTMKKIPGFSANMGIDQVMSAWDDWVKLSMEQVRRGNNVSPMDFFNSYRSREGALVRRGNWMYDMATNTPVKYVGPTSKTSTSTTINELSREDALALTKTAMAQMLGRGPTAEEVNTYMNIMNGVAKKNPSVTTTTQQIDPETGEVTNTSSVSRGGISSAGMQAAAEEKMKGSAEHKEYAATTTYYQAMMQLLTRGY